MPGRMRSGRPPWTMISPAADLTAARGRLPSLGRPLVRMGFAGAGVRSVDRFSELGSSLGVWDGQSFGIPRWTGNEPISRNPSGVPILDSCSTHGTFKAADLALFYDVLATVINRAAFTGSMMTQGGF
jgi:hypothetical protein